MLSRLWQKECRTGAKYNQIDLTANQPQPPSSPPNTHFHMASLVRNRGNNSTAIVSAEQSSVGLLVPPDG